MTLMRALWLEGARDPVVVLGVLVPFREHEVRDSSEVSYHAVACHPARLNLRPTPNRFDRVVIDIYVLPFKPGLAVYIGSHSLPFCKEFFSVTYSASPICNTSHSAVFGEAYLWVTNKPYKPVIFLRWTITT